MFTEFDEINKDKIKSLLKLKIKSSYWEKKVSSFVYEINRNKFKFVNISTFFSSINDITDLSIFFLINEEISNSIKRLPIIKLLNEIENDSKLFEININNKNNNLCEEFKDDIFYEFEDLFKNKFNEILNSQLFDFNINIFSSFEFWISKLYENYEKEANEYYIKSREEKCKQLIEKYKDSSTDNKEEILSKILNLNTFVSFPDKINFIFKKLDKNKYEKLFHRNIKKDKELIDFFRICRNTIHNLGIHNGKDKNFEFNKIMYKLENEKALFIDNQSNFILMIGELIDIYATILFSLDDDSKISCAMKINECSISIEILKLMIQDSIYSSQELDTDEEYNLILKNFNKLGIDEKMFNKLSLFIQNKKDDIVNFDEFFVEILSSKLR